MRDAMDKSQIRTLREKLRVLERESGAVFGQEQDCCGVTMSQCHTLLQVGQRESLSLVDLAGSENVRSTNAEGERLKEGGLCRRAWRTDRSACRHARQHDSVIRSRT